MKKGEVTREKILKTSIELFHRNGISSSSVKDIVDLIGIQKGSLYYFFPSKEDLVVDALSVARDRFFAFLDKSLRGEDPRRSLEYYFDAVLSYHEKREMKGGCLFGNSALEMCEKSEKIREVLTSVFEGWHSRLSEVLKRGVEKGVLSPEIDPDEFSWHIIATIEGGIMLARSFKDVELLRISLEGLKQRLFG